KGSEPGRAISLPRTSSKSPLPFSVSRASRSDLQRPGGEGAPERVDETPVQKIGAVAQPSRQIGLAPGGRAARLRAQLACLGHNAPRFGCARDRVAPGDGVVAGRPGQHEALVAVEDRQKLGWSFRGYPLGVVD